MSLKNKMPGVSLIELMVVITISSLLFVGLLGLLQQMVRVYYSAENIIGLRMRAATFEARFSQDVAGVFVPAVSAPEKKAQTPEQPAAPDKTAAQPPEKPGSEPASKEQAAKGEQKTPLAAAATQGKEQAPPPAPEQQPEAEPATGETSQANIVFYAVQTEQNLSMISFVTDNSMIANVATKTGKPMSRIVRVKYQLLPEAGHPDSYLLVRQEIPDLQIPFTQEQHERAPDAYVLIAGVAEFSATFGFVIEEEEKKEEGPKEESKKTEPQPQRKKQKKVKTVTMWNKEKEGELPLLPKFIKIKLVLWSKDYHKKETTNFYFEVPVQVLKPVSAARAGARRPAPSKPEEKKEAPIAPGTPAQPPQTPQPPAKSDKLTFNNRTGNPFSKLPIGRGRR